MCDVGDEHSVSQLSRAWMASLSYPGGNIPSMMAQAGGCACLALLCLIGRGGSPLGCFASKEFMVILGWVLGVFAREAPRAVRGGSGKMTPSVW